ncbi:hypothetical protein [Streptomyces sp. NPDC092903]|uniref:hypothetical protein n=1 Tax=Streptomyces sp. NPDC092903 TaxID=3366017 RepID=UPI003802D25E
MTEDEHRYRAKVTDLDAGTWTSQPFGNPYEAAGHLGAELTAAGYEAERGGGLGVTTRCAGKQLRDLAVGHQESSGTQRNEPLPAMGHGVSFGGRVRERAGSIHGDLEAEHGKDDCGDAQQDTQEHSGPAADPAVHHCSHSPSL